MWQLATAFAEIALRRRGPESLPDSTFLVLALLAARFVVALFDLVMVGAVNGVNLIYLILDAALWLAFVFAILRFFKLERRYRQTIAATLGAQLAIYLAYLPIAFGALILGFELTEMPFYWVRLIILLFWTEFVAAWVLARALSQPLIVGLMFEILYVLTSLSIGDLLITPADPSSAVSSTLESTA